jgi:hypothetical protein
MRTRQLVLVWLLALCQPMLWSQAITTQPEATTDPQPGSTPVFHTGTSLVLVDLIAQNPKTGMPLNTLLSQDFRLFDNNKEVPITTFDSGSHYSTRPIALWFVVICNEKNNGPHGEYASGGFLGKESLFRPALDDLDKNDRVGVAHWCDNGDARLDLPPTQNRDSAISALAEALKPFDFDTPPPSKRRPGELALQKLIRLIIADAHGRNPQPLPVILVLHSDHTGMPAPELDKLVDEFLATSGIVFGLKDADVRDFIFGPLGNGEEGSIWHYMAAETGGQYFSVHPNLYATATKSVLLQLHFRYQLGFKPRSIDGKRHELKVEFAPEAKQQTKGVQLRYRPEYIPNEN